MKKFALFFNEEKPMARKIVPRLKSWLKKKGIKTVIPMHKSGQLHNIDLAVALGGDGTMLKVARKIAPYGIPLFGVNLGSLGFLAEMDWAHLYTVLNQVIRGNSKVEKRLMIDVSMDKPSRINKASFHNIALNDCVIRCGDIARVIVLDVWVGKHFLTRYLGDGLIVATPTGSTAYSLSASGPIVHPAVGVFIISPICPHTLAQRPIIVSADETIRIVVKEHDPREPAILSLDGQINSQVKTEHIIMVKRAKYDLFLIANPNQNYFSILREKMGWGKR